MVGGAVFDDDPYDQPVGASPSPPGRIPARAPRWPVSALNAHWSNQQQRAVKLLERPISLLDFVPSADRADIIAGTAAADAAFALLTAAAP